MDMQQAISAVQDPRTTPETLAFIAQHYPALRPHVLAHPNCYPGLSQWIQQADAAAAPAIPGPAPTTPGPATYGVPTVPTVPAAATMPSASPATPVVPADPTGPAAPPTPAMPGPPSGGKKPSRWVIPAAVAGVVAVGAAVGGYFWLTGSGTGIALDTFYSGVPVIEGSAQLPEVMATKDLRLSPQAHAALRNDQIAVVALQPSDDSPETTFVAFNDEQVGYPQWTVTLATAAPHCTLTATSFDCGEAGVFDVETGWPAGQGASPSGTGEDEAAADSSGFNSGDVDSGDVYDQEGAVTTGSDGDVDDQGDAVDPGSDGDVDQESGAPIPGDGQSADEDDDLSLGVTADMEQVGPSPTDEVPFAFINGELQDDKGNVLESFSGEGVWALSDRGNGGRFWVFSDGQKLVAVKGNNVAWTAELPAGSAEVNQFDTDAPTWALDGSTLMVGEPDRVVGYSPKDGAEQWVVDAPGLTSWSAQAPDLFLVSGDVLHVAHFVEKQDVPQSDSTPIGEVLTLEQPWGEEQFTNGTYQLPSGCVEWAFLEPANFGFATLEEMQDHHFDMVGGTVGETGYGKVTYDTSVPLYAGGRAYSLAQFWCDNGGMYPFQYKGVYNSSGELVADEFAEPQMLIGGFAPHPNFQDLQASGSVFTQELSGIGVAGDDSCGGCATSGSATITSGWDGRNLRRLDILYHTPLGDSRTPNLGAVQAAYDAAASGDDATAAKYFTPEAMADIKTGSWCGFLGCPSGEGAPVRDALLPEGAAVEQCVLAASDFTTSLGNSFGQGHSFSEQALRGQPPVIVGDMYGPNRSSDRGEDYFPGGTYFCGINTEGTGHDVESPMTLAGDDNPHYTLWLAVQSDPEGNPSNMTVVENASRIPGVIG